MAAGDNLPPGVRDAIIADLRAGGHSCRSLADKHGVAFSTVSAIAKAEVPGAFDRTRTAKAAHARAADGKVRRAALRERLLDRAAELIDATDQPYRVYAFDRDGRYHEHERPRPPAGEIRNLMTSAAIAIDKYTRLEAIDNDDRDLPAVDAWINAMTGGPSEPPGR
ncbi:hypothetical protein GCM10027294_43670 [Marinactinospora endophytica]